MLASLAGYLLLNIIYAVNAFFFHELKVGWGKFEFSASARSDGVLVVRVPARSDRGRPRLPPWDQRPPGGHDRC